jgi:hypothetical protein
VWPFQGSAEIRGEAEEALDGEGALARARANLQDTIDVQFHNLH